MGESVQKIELRYTCEFCGAAPGEWCRRTTNGKRAPMIHASRWYQAEADGVLPWQVGERDG